jgi:ABC-type spermidine/putrescine transport system permease subunit II
VLPIALPGVMSAALFAFLASFDELLISLFLAGVHAQTLPVRIWNSLNLQVEPTIAAVSAFLIAVTTLILAVDGFLRHRRGRRRARPLPIERDGSGSSALSLPQPADSAVPG